MSENSKTINSFAEAQYNKMINTPVSKIVIKLAIPTIISMLVTSLYNMADTFFVSKINTQSSAAVGIVFPVMAIIQACGFTFGMGSGSLISRRLGEKKNEEACVVASTAFFSTLIIGALITIFGNLFSDSILKSIGASETVLPYAHDYASFIFWGAPFMCASFVLNNDLRSEGKSLFSMIALGSGGIINMILDPVFIFGLKLGIRGAAIATLISQFISFILLLSWYWRKKVICRINIKYFVKGLPLLGLIAATGTPSLARQGLASIASILMNRRAMVYGDSAIAAMTIVAKILMFIGSIMIGIGQGFTPVSGYNYGAKRYDRVKKAYGFTVSCGMSLLSIFAVSGCIFAPQIIKAFIDDEEVIRIGTVALRCQICVLPLHPLIVTTNMLLQSTGNIKSSTFLSCNRQGVYFIPAIIILPMLLGLTGVEITQAVSDFLSAITAIPYLIWFMKKLDKKIEQN